MKPIHCYVLEILMLDDNVYHEHILGCEFYGREHLERMYRGKGRLAKSTKSDMPIRRRDQLEVLEATT